MRRADRGVWTSRGMSRGRCATQTLRPRRRPRVEGAAVDHHAARQLKGRQRAAHTVHVRLRVVRPQRATVQHHVAVVVARRLDDAGDALLGDGEEGVRRAKEAFTANAGAAVNLSSANIS